jgi:tetratricopeptide (TPR) repeat protein
MESITFALFRLSMMHRIRCRVLSFFLLVTCAHCCPAQGPAAQDEVGGISDALRTRNFTLALTLSQTALVKRPNDYRIWTLRGMATAGTGNLPLAVSAYRHALRLAPDYLPALEGAAQTEFQMGHDAARPLLLKVLAQRPEDPTTHAMLGVLEYRNRNCSEAVIHFQNAAAVIRSQPEALTGFGLCLAALKRNEDAVAVFAQALALDPAKSLARYNLALAQWNFHLAEDALTTLEPLIDATPADGDALVLGTEILESKGDTSHAIELLRKAILEYPKDVDAYLQFATLSYDHASPQVGIDILNVGITQLPNEPRLYLVRGILLTQFGEFTRATEDFETASRIDPNLQFLAVAEGLVKSQRHNSTQALSEFRAAVKAHPNEAYAQYLLAEALQEQGKSEGSPEYREEVAAAKRAITLDPSMVAAHDLLSTVYLVNGHTDLAIEQSRAALALDPSDQQAVYHLIVELRKTDQKDQIPMLLKRMIELRTNAENSHEAKKQYRLYETQLPASATAPSTP